jgi:arylsulfatase A-like enzyme
MSVKRPNILVLMTDDHGPWAVNCCGTPVIDSPAMDHLAATGARLTRAFTPCPVCSPARASFFTGTLPSQHGIHDYIEYDRLPSGHAGLDGQPLISEVLQAAGYHTGLCGKWHCGDQATPQRGFDHWFSYADTQYPHCGDIAFSRNGEHLPYHGFQTHAITDEAVAFLDAAPAESPFFLFVGYVDTHTPYSDHPSRLVEHYRQADLSGIPSEPFAACHGTTLGDWAAEAEHHQEWLAQYLAAVTMIDSQLGRLLDELDGRGLREDTLVIYTSDHGHNNGHHGIHCKGNVTTPQNFIEESVMVPSLWSWPACIGAGQVVDEMFDHCDLFATLADAADAPIPAAVNTPGRSLLPRLRGGQVTDWRRLQFFDYGTARAARDSRFKLIRRWPGPNGHFPDELYDLEQDPRETENCIDGAAHATVVADLSAAIDTHFAQYEVATRSGLRVGDQPPVNGNEPWRRPAPADGR